MPTIFTHPVVAIAAKPYLGECARRPAIWVTGAVLTILPDLDVIGFYYGIPYGHVLGHRGLTHSLPFALVVGALAAAVAAYPARELMWIWTPAIVILVVGVWIRSRRRRV